MWCLIRKEWKENRALILGFTILAPLLSLGFKGLLVGWNGVLPHDSLLFVVPILLTLFAIGLAADLVAADSSSGRIAFFAAQPVSPSVVWASKAVFLFGLTALFAAYLYGVECAILSAAGFSTEHLAGPWLEMTAPLLIAPFVIGTATLFYSTLIDRGFAAAFAALATMAGLVLVGRLVVLDLQLDGDWFSVRKLAYRPKGSPTVLLTTLGFLGAGFLLGSWAAFTRGRIHLGGRVRRVAFAILGLLLLTAPPAVDAAVRIDEYKSFDFSEQAVRLHVWNTDPEGRWALVGAVRRGEAPLGMRPPRAIWAVRLADGLCRDLTPYGGYGKGSSSRFLEGPGLISLLREEESPDGDRKFWLRIIYDLEKGEPVSTRVISPNESQEEWRSRIGARRPYYYSSRGAGRVRYRDREAALPKGWNCAWYNGFSPWGVVVRRYRHRKQVWGLLDLESGDITRVPELKGSVWTHFLLPRTRAGCILAVAGSRGDGRGGLAELSSEGAFRRWIERGTVWSWGATGDHDTVLVQFAGGSAHLLEREGDELAIRPAPHFPGRDRPHIISAPDSRGFLLVYGNRAVYLDLDGPQPTLRETRLVRNGRWPQWFDGERLLLQTSEGGPISLADYEGNTRQLLPATSD